MQDTNRNRKLLAGLVGVNLALALAVGAGAVPLTGDNGKVRTAAISQAEELAAPAARQPSDTAPAAPQAAVPVSPAEAAPATTTPTVPKPKITAPPTTKAAVVKAAPTTSPPAVAPVAAVAAAPAKVARRTPTSAEVQAAIAELKRHIGTLALFYNPTEAQIAQAGDQVCTAFDGGQTFAQVKATGLTMIPTTVTVPPGTVDLGVRKGVALYCPGHASKLV